MRRRLRASTALVGIVCGALLVDVKTGKSTPLPKPPFENPLYIPRAAVVGKTVLVLGTSCGKADKTSDLADEPECRPGTFTGATFDLRDRTWHELALPTELRGRLRWARPLGTTNDGRAVIAFAEGSYAAEQVWTYAPRTQAWAHVGVPATFVNGACLTGDTLRVAIIKFERLGVVQDGETYWRPQAGSGGTFGLLDGYVQPALVNFDLGTGTTTTTAVAESVKFNQSGVPAIHCMGQSTLVESGLSMRVYDAAASTWRVPAAIPAGYHVDPIWNGSELLYRPTVDDPSRGSRTTRRPTGGERCAGSATPTVTRCGTGTRSSDTPSHTATAPVARRPVRRWACSATSCRPDRSPSAGSARTCHRCRRPAEGGARRGRARSRVRRAVAAR